MKRPGIKKGQRHRYPAHPYVFLTFLLYSTASWIQPTEGGIWWLVDLHAAEKNIKIRKDLLKSSIAYLSDFNIVTVSPLSTPTLIKLKLADPERPIKLPIKEA